MAKVVSMPKKALAVILPAWMYFPVVQLFDMLIEISKEIHTSSLDTIIQTNQELKARKKYKAKLQKVQKIDVPEWKSVLPKMLTGS